MPNRAEAICLSCNVFLCLTCCILHSQSNPSHAIKQIASSATATISARAKGLFSSLGEHLEVLRRGRQDKQPQSLNVSPEAFEKHLNEIEFIKKEALATVERFFEELSLEFVSMWEEYLVKFSSGAAAIERMSALHLSLKKFTSEEELESDPSLLKAYIA
jgi:hypothetical protein